MRTNIEFEVFGETIDTLIIEAKTRWRRLSNNPDAELPHDAEMHVTSRGDAYAARVMIRLKVENG
jgi:hypothetical protein